VASYVVPNAFNRRFLLTANLRSLFHFIQLRSAPNAHFSVRRFAQRLSNELNNVLPEFSQYLPVNHLESETQIESTFFTETMRG
jgi:thymidylate synthase ThyX